MKQKFCLLLALLLICGLCACGAQPAAPDAGTCTLEIRCDTLLNHLDELDSAVAALVPADGCLLAPTEVSLVEGNTVFDVLQRTIRAQDMHMEFSTSAAYNTAYIEGIGNIYELDAGPLSGWTYCVNGVFPSYGVSACAVQDGDVIQLLYTCDLGADVGNSYSEDTP